ncbi:Na+/H+ antiporter subunit E [candidate division NPL-UPA2 bacterium]|nr:Na+/H+ antiporter subunit E [candidate division NPL-UPA2 bacterium]
MRRLVLFIIAFIAWFLLVWPFDTLTNHLRWQSVIAGLVVALLTTIIFGEVRPRVPRQGIIKRCLWAICYLPVLFWYCLLANLDVVYRVLHPEMPIKPGIVKVKTSLSTASAITALCNSITLTPGTLTVDLTEDGYLYIHWINVRATDIEKASRIIVSRFERILRRIFE